MPGRALSWLYTITCKQAASEQALAFADDMQCMAAVCMRPPLSLL